MINTTDTAGHLIDIITKEIELIDSFTVVEASIMDSVINNNWDFLEAAITQAEGISGLIEALDRERDFHVEKLRESSGEDKSAHFYRLTARLETEQRDKLNELYRKLKLSVLNLQNMNWRIDAYVGTVTGIMKQTLKEIYPNRRGSLYSKSGTIREAESNPMVLNKKL
ncbi:MAG: hypothetical protein KAR21_27650 [Spirochaetales bacterium]|nr:hypothetical protein [Spirochaetales bacterium]